MGALFQSWIPPWRICLIAGALTVFLRKRNLVVVVAILLGAMVMSFRQVSLDTSDIHKSIGQKLTLEFTVVTDPKVITNGKISLIAKAKGVPIRVIGFGDTFLPSAKFRASGKLFESKEPRVAAMFLSWEKFEPIDGANWWQQKLGNIRGDLRKVSVGAPLIPGMVLGDTSLQTSEFSDAMRKSGLTHLTAVSGANFAIVSSFVLWLMQYPIRRIRIRLFATSFVLIAFIGLVRPSPSVLRAAAMAAVVIFAKSHRERSDSIPSLGFAIAIVILADPWQARDPGFALSVLATAGLLIIAPRLKLPKGFAEPIAATILCSPIIVALSGYLSITSILANVLAAPLVAPVTILGFVAALLPPTAPFLIFLAKIPAMLITKIAYAAANFPVIHMKSALIIVVLALLIFTLKKYLVLLIPLLLLLTFLQRWPNNNWQIANCDVGQGDAMVLKVAPHSAVLIDTGPDPKLIDRCLRSLSIREIPLLMITHPHEDHSGGLFGAVRNRKVGEIMDKAQRGEIIQVKDLRIEILWPDGSEHEFVDNGGEGSAINNQSIVALISSPNYTLLTTGDVEPDVQALIHPPKIDYLKVAHHGSKYQDLNFNRFADPELAIISVGAGNKYGHPAASTERLFKRVYRTDKDGAIAIDPVTRSLSSSKVGAFGLPVLWRVA